MKLRHISLAIVLILCFLAILVAQLLPPSFTAWQTVQVQAGQTLWALASQKISDVSDAVIAIEQRNHITANIQPGQTIQVPTQAIPLWKSLLN